MIECVYVDLLRVNCFVLTKVGVSRLKAFHSVRLDGQIDLYVNEEEESRHDTLLSLSY